MAARGLKPRTLSVRAGLNPEHVRQFLKGDSRSTTVETTQRLAAALGVEPSWLVGGDAPAATPVPNSGPLAFASALTLRRYLEDIDLASIRAIRETLVTAGLAALGGVGGDSPAAIPVPDLGPLAFASAVTLRRCLEDIELASIRVMRETLVRAGLATPRLLSLHEQAEQIRASLRSRANDTDD
jgi:transcriptional regulator with XRE-family HTH domain